MPDTTTGSLDGLLTLQDLRSARCSHLDTGHALEPARIALQLACLPRWENRDNCLVASFECRDWWDTIAFVNALAWLADRQDHHPDLSLSYRRCEVRWTTHSAGGVSLNDFICAAATDTLFDTRPT